MLFDPPQHHHNDLNSVRNISNSLKQQHLFNLSSIYEMNLSVYLSFLDRKKVIIDRTALIKISIKNKNKNTP